MWAHTQCTCTTRCHVAYAYAAHAHTPVWRALALVEGGRCCLRSRFRVGALLVRALAPHAERRIRDWLDGVFGHPLLIEGARLSLELLLLALQLEELHCERQGQRADLLHAIDGDEALRVERLQLRLRAEILVPVGDACERTVSLAFAVVSKSREWENVATCDVCGHAPSPARGAPQ